MAAFDIHQLTDTMMTGGWFGVAVTAFVTSTKLRYVEPG